MADRPNALQPSVHQSNISYGQPNPSNTRPGTAPGALWNNSNPPQPRGRAPRDPNARSSKYHCNSIEEMEDSLKAFLDDPPASPEHSTCEITLSTFANLLGSDEDDVPGLPRNVHEALLSAPDPKDNMKKQRAVSKICVAAVQRVDGYRYSFHNNWKSGEENAFRFSYYCNDSLLNKDRVANGKAGSQGRRATKPVYDCKGVLSIKFSATRQVIEVHYKHIPCHPTYEERAPTPRRNSKRRASWEKQNPERSKRGGMPSSPGEEVDRPAKRPRPIEAVPKSIESQLREQSMTSLLELIRPETSNSGMPQNPNMNMSGMPNGVPSAAQPPMNTQSTKSPAEPQPSVICETCLHRRAKCDGVKPKCGACTSKNWPCWYTPSSGADANAPRVSRPVSARAAESPNIHQAPKEKPPTEKFKKERDQLQQTLKQTRDEMDNLKKKLQEQEDMIKKLEERATNSQLSQPQPLPLPQAQQTQNYPNHPMTQSTRLTPTYATHGSERALTPNQAFSNTMVAQAAAHPPRGQMFHGPNQQMVQNRWPPGTQFMPYQQPNDSHLWNTTHMQPQLR